VEPDVEFVNGAFDQIQIVLSIVVTELIESGRLHPDTVTAIRDAYGSDWWVCISEWLCVPIDADGTANWSSIDFDHETAAVFENRFVFT
jgi:hypothetical protein